MAATLSLLGAFRVDPFFYLFCVLCSGPLFRRWRSSRVNAPASSLGATAILHALTVKRLLSLLPLVQNVDTGVRGPLSLTRGRRTQRSSAKLFSAIIAERVGGVFGAPLLSCAPAVAEAQCVAEAAARVFPGILGIVRGLQTLHAIGRHTLGIVRLLFCPMPMVTVVSV